MSLVEKFITIDAGIDWEFSNNMSTVHTNYKQ